MSRSPLAFVATLLGAGILCWAAEAQSLGPLTGADCREARLDRVSQGKVRSRESVIICKRTDQLKAALAGAGAPVAAARPEQIIRLDRLAFSPPANSDRECAMLNCPTYVLTGIGD
jgi:hypothetical protein